MKHFLMCEPKFFEVCYVINPWMEGNLGKVDRKLAWGQWENLHNIMTELASVSLIEPVEGLPDMVFTANAGLVHRRNAIVAAFRHAERQPEAALFEQFFLAHGYRVLHTDACTLFEGAGDALFDSAGRLWMASGFRSDPHAMQQVAQLLDVEACGLELIDPRWYHLDTAFCPLPDGQAIVHTGAFSEKSIEALERAFGANLIRVSGADARNFACNAISIGRSVVMHSASAELKAALEQRGLEVIEADVSEFLKAGGACKCLTLEI